jgi:hypothetical protein
MKNLFLLLLPFALLSFSAKGDNGNFRKQISLEGRWQFAIDTANVGVTQRWFVQNLSDAVDLPGTMDQNRKGLVNRDTTTMHLCRVYKYEGAAWYRKKVLIPKDFQGKHVELLLERTKSSQVWVDSMLVGESSLLQSAQQLDVTRYITPGEHYITIRVDNSLKLTPYGSVHIYSDDTQTNWNGIVGKLLLEATAKTYISKLRAYPDIDNRKVNVKVDIANGLNLKDVDVVLMLEKNFNGKSVLLKPLKVTTACEPTITLEYALGDDCSLWDEYQQPLYKVSAVLLGKKVNDSKSVTFGMRRFTAKGTQFDINGRTTFLRGKHDGCVFPLTGYPPMDVEGWLRVFRIAKQYGINHYRFHSYCPPEAAFDAADREGIYIQAELPFWGGLESDTVASKLKDEGIAMLDSYANHPSFVMLSAGNEIWSGHDRVEKNMVALKKFDGCVLYAMGSNNNIGFVGPRGYSDFFVGARTPYSHDTILTHIRLMHAFADSKDGGIINTQVPSTEVRFTYPVSQLKMPIVSHEIGQYQVFPDYGEIAKYTGVVRAWNLEVFRNRLKKAGMLDQDVDFQKASGAWAALCYKAEMEAALRTKGFAGFQLLDLQDYPGQGTALIGILDAFMDSKKVVTEQDWRMSCNDVVLLLEFPKYCWTNNENFKATLEVANYSNQPIGNGVEWMVKRQNGDILTKGNFDSASIENGGVRLVGDVAFDLSSIKRAEKLTVTVSVKGSSYVNSYPIWVYPQPDINPVSTDGIVVADKLTDDVFAKLQQGAKVLLFPQAEDVKANSVPGLFPPEFWNYGMFKGISEWAKKPVSPGTMGILTNPKHPLFNQFPTESHTSWQWFSIIKSSNSLILDSTPTSYRPIVQVIDNLERNHKVGLIFEFRVGDGKLLVCMSQLDKLTKNPEAVQLYRSIISYMKSNNFTPSCSMDKEALGKLSLK